MGALHADLRADDRAQPRLARQFPEAGGGAEVVHVRQREMAVAHLGRGGNEPLGRHAPANGRKPAANVQGRYCKIVRHTQISDFRFQASGFRLQAYSPRRGAGEHGSYRSYKTYGLVPPHAERGSCPSFRFQVPPLFFRVPCSRFPVPLFLFRVPCSRFPVPLFLFRVPCSRFPVPPLFFRVPCSWFRCLLFPATGYRLPTTGYYFVKDGVRRMKP